MYTDLKAFGQRGLVPCNAGMMSTCYVSRTISASTRVYPFSRGMRTGNVTELNRLVIFGDGLVGGPVFRRSGSPTDRTNGVLVSA